MITMLSTPDPIIFDAAYYRQRAALYRELAKEQAAAGAPEIAKKLTEFVADLETTAAKLDASIH
jgi:hypothetical protein